MTKFLLSFVLYSSVLGNSFSNFRCRCLCPPLKSIEPSAQVYFGGNQTVEATTCTAKRVVRPRIENKTDEEGKQYPEGTIEAYLNSCDCNFELRNTGTMKVIVYVYIIAITLLLIYTGFVYFITEKYQPRTGDGMETPLFSSEGQENAHSGPVEMILTRIDSMARRWKKDVDQQRNTVFKRREALQ